MRLFFGLTLPDGVRQAAAALALAAEAAIPGRYLRSAHYHVTLAFLGEVPETRVPEAQAVLARCVKGFPAPRLTVGALSHFGRAQKAILILRVSSQPALDTLHAQLVSELTRSGLPADPGPFCPHITLARRAVLPDPLPRALLRPAHAAPFTAARAHVFLSARDSGGTLAYTPIASAPFGMPASDNPEGSRLGGGGKLIPPSPGRAPNTF